MIKRKTNQRDTCACKYCLNMSEYLVAAKREGLINFGSISDLFKAMFCEKITLDCYNRRCANCNMTQLAFNKVNGDDEIL